MNQFSKFKILLFCTIFLSGFLMCQNAQAADQTLYVRDGASGTGTGADWTNACEELPACEAKIDRATYDDVYVYVADGSYIGAEINAAVHGTDMIYIKKSTVAAHGTETGYVSTDHDGQATFQWATGTPSNQKTTILIAASYVTIDGVSGTGTDYGFVVKPPVDFGQNSNSGQDINGIYAYATGGQSNIMVTHVYADGPRDVTPNCLDYMAESGLNFNCASYGIRSKADVATRSDNIHILENYVDGWTNNISLNGTTDSTIQGNYATANANGTYIHGQNVDVQATDDVSIYNNIVHNSQVFAISFHGSTTTIGALGYSTLRTKIFNNIIDGMTGATLSMCIGSGTSETNSVRNAEVNHNTLVNVDCGGYGAFHTTATNDATAYHSHFYNNLLYNVTHANIDADTPDGIVHDYNSCLNCVGTTNIADEENDKTDADAPDPFVDSASGDYCLKIGTLPINNGKTDLGATYANDFLGNPRGASPDIGAYEYAGAADVIAPASPTGLAVT